MQCYSNLKFSKNLDQYPHHFSDPIQDKKFLLRERKRHTSHRVVSTPSVVLTGGGYPNPGPDPEGGYPIPGWGYAIPGRSTPHLDQAGVPPPLSGPGQGTPPPLWTD